MPIGTYSSFPYQYRRPRLSARTTLFPSEIRPLMRTDEGVCPYFVVFHQLILTSPR